MYTHTEVEVLYSTMDIPYIDHEDADVPIQVILESTLFLCCLNLAVIENVFTDGHNMAI